VELTKTFEPKAAEERWFQLWIDKGYFTADPTRPGPVFSVVIPPPNVTGQLHLGHALNVTLQDAIVRARRMQGYNTLWLPGTDHAGIATQNVVERELAKEGKTRHDLGREEFVKRVWAWRETYGGRILHQLRRLGASCDWSRERFTLDEGLSRAVTKVFVMLYRDGLIYRDFRLINWCPRCETALSDLEVEHKETQGSLWYIRYPLVDGSGVVTVATTRPETMLGDTAIAVHPKDPRFAGLVGKNVRVPLTNREIPLIADDTVDKDFGTGAVKVTPGHDFADFAIGRRHGLAQISVMDTRGRMTAEAGPYQGLTREACRQRVVADLEIQELLEKTEAHRLALGVCSRCETVVEPRLSYQWFLAVSKPDAHGGGESMAARAIRAVEQGATKFFPQFWENTYFAWMRNIQDWCISRQLWWGHRIPAYWCDSCENPSPIVAEERPLACPRCGGASLRQEEDVLDTWFSSGLWPFTTLGWPAATADLATYYPTSVLITGFDIIFFWVARMMMFALKINPKGDEALEDQVPFRDIYITPLIRDKFGKKMSKSRGNVVDPLEIMDRYGTDAVRFTLAQLSIQGRDLVLSDERLAASRAFANKVWNAARFILMNLESALQPLPAVPLDRLDLAERWILSRLDEATAKISKEIDAYELNNAAMTVYQFIWHEFCDWYIELAKEPLKAGGERQAAARYVLITVFDRLLRLLHPFMPFISEELWQAIRPYSSEAAASAHLAVASWPRPSGEAWLSDAERRDMQYVVSAVETLNSLRSTTGWHPGQRVESRVILYDGTEVAAVENFKRYVRTLAKTELLVEASRDQADRKGFIFRVTSWADVGIRTPEGFDLAAARAAVCKKLDEVRGHLERNRGRYENPGFRAKADPDTVAEIAEKIDELTTQSRLLEMQLEQLQ